MYDTLLYDEKGGRMSGKGGSLFYIMYTKKMSYCMLYPIEEK